MSQSVDLFEVQRIWDAWPNIRNQQVSRFRGILQAFFFKCGNEIMCMSVFVSMLLGIEGQVSQALF